MIGQQVTLDLINKYNSSNFPRFSIIVGQRGSGKSEIINYINENIIKAEIIPVNTISDVRRIFVDAPAYSVYKLCVLSDFDSMNFRAKESILKLCEDIPNNLYIMIETDSLSNIKSTLVSRANVIQLQQYSDEELRQFCFTLDDLKDEELDYLIAAFKTPGDIIRAHNCGIISLYSFCYNVINNIYNANLFNAMNIANKLKLKSDGDGFELDLFFTVLLHCAKFYLPINDALNFISVTSKTLNTLSSIKTINKLMLFDTWLCSVKGRGDTYE